MMKINIMVIQFLRKRISLFGLNPFINKGLANF